MVVLAYKKACKGCIIIICMCVFLCTIVEDTCTNNLSLINQEVIIRSRHPWFLWLKKNPKLTELLDIFTVVGIKNILHVDVKNIFKVVNLCFGYYGLFAANLLVPHFAQRVKSYCII